MSGDVVVGPESPIRIVLADDHPRVRAQVREALEMAGMVVCAEAGNGGDAVALTLEHEPDVALLDVHMPGSGIYAADEITRRLPHISVVMLSQSTEDEDLFDSLRAGASGYLLKGGDPAELAGALRDVLRHGSVMTPQLVGRLMQEFRAPRRRPFARSSSVAAKLSTREWEVMLLLSDGLTTDEVAKRLFLSPTTVRVHVSSVLRKLRVKDREAAFSLLREDLSARTPALPVR